MNFSRSLGHFVGFSSGLVIILLIAFAVMTWLDIPTGHFLDWVIAIASFFWLIAITTIPWNIHFQARQVVIDSEVSVKKGIRVDEKQVAYVKVIRERALYVAILLHVVSAAVLYGLAAMGVSVVGYVASGAALLLTGLRPAMRAYEFIVAQLTAIQREFKYPREDMLTLKADVDQLKNRVKGLENAIKALDKKFTEQTNTLTASHQRETTRFEAETDTLRTNLQDLKANNQADHDRLSREAQRAISQLSEDSQFLNHVREIIRFFKNVE